MGNKKSKGNIILVIAIIFIVIGVIIKGFLMTDKKTKSNITGRYITDEHYRYSPVKFNNEIYFPNSREFGKDKDLKSLGFLGRKEAGWFNDSILLTGAILVPKEDVEYTHFDVRDDLAMSYSKATYLESEEVMKNNFESYDKFALCTDKEEKDVRVSIEKEVVVKLEEEFGQVTYNKEDFDEYDEIHFIYVDAPDHKTHDRVFDEPIIYIGTIFEKNNKLYYGNYDNEIKGETFEYISSKL